MHCVFDGVYDNYRMVLLCYIMIRRSRLLSPCRFMKQERTVVTSDTVTVPDVTRYAPFYMFREVVCFG